MAARVPFFFSRNLILTVIDFCLLVFVMKVFGCCRVSAFCKRFFLLLPALLAFLFRKLREHTLVFDAKFTSTKFKPVHFLHDSFSVFGRTIVCERQPPENAIVKMIIESIGKRDIKRALYTLFCGW